MQIDTPSLFAGLAVLAVLAVGALLLRGRGAQSAALTVLIGKVEAAAAAQDRQGERLALLEGGMDARLARQEQALADRVNAVVIDQTKVLHSAVMGQNDRLAEQEKAIAARLAAAEKLLADSIKAQNETLGAVLSGQTERVTKQLAEQAQAAANTAAAITERLAVIDAARGNIEALGAQVGGLAAILSNKQSRGFFGEVQLQRLIEDRLPIGGYTLQATLPNGTRADCLIHLPTPPGPIVVDSKFPLENWYPLRDAADDAARLAATSAFARDVKKHIADIGEKYILDGETAEGALMFLPSEAIYVELHANHPALIDEAVRRRVYIVSPTTTWAVLGTLAALMRDVRMRNNARAIQKEVAALLNDLRLLSDRVDNLKSHFAQATRDITQIETSRDKMVKGGARIRDVELPDDAAALPTLPGPNAA